MHAVSLPSRTNEPTSNSFYNTILSCKVARCALSALTWLGGAATVYQIVFCANPYLGFALWGTAASISLLTATYFLFRTSPNHYINKVTLIALGTFFYLGGFSASLFVATSIVSFHTLYYSALLPCLDLALSGLSQGLYSVGILLPIAIKTHQLAARTFSGVNAPLKSLPSEFDNFAAFIPKYIRHLILANTCLLIEKDGFKTFLLRLDYYEITLQELLSALKAPDKLLFFWSKCDELAADADRIMDFCISLSEKIDAVQTSAEADALMEEFSKNTKQSLDIITLFKRLDRSEYLDKANTLMLFYEDVLKSQSFITKIKAKQTFVEEDDETTPAYEVLGHLMSEKQCRQYIKELNIEMESSGAIATFQHQLEKHGLGTLKQLQEAKLYPHQGAQEEQKNLLLAKLVILKGGNGSFFQNFLTFVNTKNVPVQETLKKVALRVKKIFIETIFWCTRIVAILANPWLNGAGFAYGMLYSNRFSQVEFNIPDADSVLYAETTITSARQFFFAMFANRFMGLSGFLTARAILRVARIAH